MNGMRYTREQLSDIAVSVGDRTGWDFSRMRSRRDPVPWEYLDVARQYIRPTDAVLDIGTGGGEKLLSLASSFRTGVGLDPDPDMIAVARANGAGRPNVRFLPMGAESLDLDHESFDVVLTRHAPVQVPEVVRVLKPGGWFVSQQVGANNMANIRQAFKTGSGSQYGDDERARVDDFTRLGCHVVATGAYDVRSWVSDVHSLVFWLGAIAGANEVPADFSIDRHWSVVNGIIAETATRHGFLTNEHRTLLVVHKPQ